jgi:hypothetical protein
MVDRDLGQFDRVIVGFNSDRVFFTPGVMIRDSERDETMVRLHNVFAGLQLYQAFNNEVGGLLELPDKTEILEEIFRDPADLVNLARAVETQTGTEGLVQSMLDSIGWTDWAIYPQLGDVTEQIYTLPHISLQLTMGKGRRQLRAVSVRQVSFDQEKQRLESSVEKFGFTEFDKEGKVVRYYDEGLKQGRLRYVNTLPGKFIKLRFTQEPERHVPEKFSSPLRTYVLDTRGQYVDEGTEEFTDWKGQVQVLLKESGEPFTILNREEMPAPYTYWKQVEEQVSQPFYKRHLIRFLIPYCDMPTTDGNYYVLSEDSYLIPPIKPDQDIPGVHIYRAGDSGE